jgi:hypothetical protein
LWSGGGQSFVQARSRSRRKTTEVDDVETAIQVTPIGLKAHGHSVAFVDVQAQRGVGGEHGQDATAIEVDAVDYLRAVLVKGVGSIAGEGEGQT